MQAWAESLGNGWTADQVWGFEEVDGKRHYVRHVVARKGDDWKQARLVYDYKGYVLSLSWWALGPLNGPEVADPFNQAAGEEIQRG